MELEKLVELTAEEINKFHVDVEKSHDFLIHLKMFLLKFNDLVDYMTENKKEYESLEDIAYKIDNVLKNLRLPAKCFHGTDGFNIVIKY